MIERLFRHKILHLLKEEGAIDAAVVENLLSWPHTALRWDEKADLRSRSTLQGSSISPRPPLACFRATKLVRRRACSRWICDRGEIPAAAGAESGFEVPIR